MSNNQLLTLQGLAFFLLIASAILSFIQDDYANWALNMCLAFMILSAGPVSMGDT